MPVTNIRGPTRPWKNWAALEPVYGSPTVTAGNASGIADGATATILMKEEEARKRGIVPLGTILTYAPICGEPRESPLLPAIAIRKALSQADLTLDEMKFIEINEAFAAMPLVSTLVLANFDRRKAEKIRERVNVNGGAVAIGHPIGATGARLLMNMLYELRRQGRGLRDGGHLRSHRPGGCGHCRSVTDRCVPVGQGFRILKQRNTSKETG